MAIKTSGSLAISEIAAEFDAPQNTPLSGFYRGGAYVPDAPINANVPTSGAIKFADFYGASKAYVWTVSGTNEYYNLYNDFVNRFGTPSVGVVVNVTLASGSVFGSRNTTAAFTVGQFPSGSVITIDNYGSIQGKGGSPNGGSGGDALNGAFGSQTVVFNNYGSVYAGGGAGGKGGTGGTGGNGYYQSTTYYGQGFCRSGANLGCSDKYPGSSCQSTQQACTYFDPFAQPGFQCDNCGIVNTYYTSGGAGGGGGNGGQGQGYGQGRTNGSGGAAGSAGGQNAGRGGTGGTGGNGGGWGAGGGTGNTGGTGANGNNGGGQSGSGGTGGGGAGRYLVKGSANFTFNNSGQVAGGTA